LQKNTKKIGINCALEIPVFHVTLDVASAKWLDVCARIVLISFFSFLPSAAKNWTL